MAIFDTTVDAVTRTVQRGYRRVPRPEPPEIDLGERQRAAYESTAPPSDQYRLERRQAGERRFGGFEQVEARRRAILEAGRERPTISGPTFSDVRGWPAGLKPDAARLRALRAQHIADLMTRGYSYEDALVEVMGSRHQQTGLQGFIFEQDPFLGGVVQPAAGRVGRRFGEEAGGIFGGMIPAGRGRSRRREGERVGGAVGEFVGEALVPTRGYEIVGEAVPGIGGTRGLLVGGRRIADRTLRHQLFVRAAERAGLSYADFVVSPAGQQMAQRGTLTLLRDTPEAEAIIRTLSSEQGGIPPEVANPLLRLIRAPEDVGATGGRQVLGEAQRKVRIGELKVLIRNAEADFDQAIGVERRQALARRLEALQRELAQLENQPLPGQADIFGHVIEEAPPPVRETTQQGGLFDEPPAPPERTGAPPAAPGAPLPTIEVRPPFTIERTMPGNGYRVMGADGQWVGSANASPQEAQQIIDALESGESVTFRSVSGSRIYRARGRAVEEVSPPGEPLAEQGAARSAPEPAAAAPETPARIPQESAEPPVTSAVEEAPAAPVEGELPRVTVDIDNLDFRPHLFQARDVAEGQPFNPAQVEKLRRLQERGTTIGPPTVVRNPEAPGRYIVIVGHNRTQLAREAGARRITVKVDPADVTRPDDLARIQQTAITSNYKTGTSFSEDARAFTRLQDQGEDAEGIRALTKAKSRGTVEDVLDAARLGQQAIERMNIDKTAQAIGAELGAGIRRGVLDIEEANALFNRFLNPDEGGKITSRKAVKDTVAMLGRMKSAGKMEQFAGFEGMEGGAVKLLNEFVLKKQELEAAKREASSLKGKLDRVVKDPKRSQAARDRAAQTAKDAKDEQARLEKELGQLETGVKREIAPPKAQRAKDRNVRQQVQRTLTARDEGGRGGLVDLRVMSNAELSAALKGDADALAKARGLLGESQLEGRLTRFDTPELVAARKLQDDVRERQLYRDRDTGEIVNDTPERQAERARLIDAEMEKHATQGNEAWIVLGPPAAGKSKVVIEPYIERTGARLIDSDAYKGPLAKFEGLIDEVAEGGDGYGGAVHDASDLVWEGVLDRAIANGDNLALPLVGKNAGRIEELGRRLQDAGYDVHLKLVDLPTDKAAARSVTRFHEDGRLVDPAYVLTIDGRPQATFDTLKTREWVSEFERFNNDVRFGDPPELVERGSRAEEAARGGARGEARPGAAAGRAAGGGPGPEPRGAEPLQQREPLEAPDYLTLTPDETAAVLKGEESAVEQRIAQAAAGEGLPPPPEPPVAQAYSGGKGGGKKRTPEGLLAEMLDRPPDEPFMRAMARKYAGMRNDEAVGMMRWYHDGQAIARRLKIERGPQQTARKRAFVLWLHGEGPPVEAWRELYDFLQVRKKAHESRLLAADPAFERKLLPDYWPRSFKQESAVRRQLQRFISRKRPGTKPGFAIGRKYDSLEQALANGEDLVTWDPIDQWVRRELEGVQYIYTKLVLDAMKREGRVLKASDAPGDWLTPPYKAFEPKPYAMTPELALRQDIPVVEARGMFDELAEQPPSPQRPVAQGGGVGYTEPQRVAPDDYKWLVRMYGTPFKELDAVDMLAAFAGVSKKLKVVGGLFQHIDLTFRTLARANSRLLRGDFSDTARLYLAVPSAWWRTINPLERGKVLDRALSPERALMRQEGLQELGGLDIMRNTVADAVGDPGRWGIGAAKNIPVLRRANSVLEFVNGSLYDALHPELVGAVAESLYRETRRAHPEWTARQAAARSADATNVIMSSLPEWQSQAPPRIRQFLRGIFFSPNETEAWMRQIAGAVAGPNARYFREQWQGYIITFLALAEGINYAFTGEHLGPDQLSPISTEDADGLADTGIGASITFNTRFMRPRLTGDGPAGKLGLFEGESGRYIYLDLLGQADTPIRWLLAPTSAIQSRFAVGPNVLRGLISGREPFTEEPVETLRERATFAAREFGAPIPVSTYLQEGRYVGAGGSALQAAGLNVSRERLGELRNRTSKAETGVEYDLLDTQAKKDYAARHPDHFASPEDLVEGSQIRTSVQLKRDKEAEIRRLGESVKASGDYTRYGDLRGEITGEYIARRKQLPEQDFPAPKTLDGKALDLYYSAIDAAEQASPRGRFEGTEDWARAEEAARKQVGIQLGPQGAAALDKALMASADPVEREYLETRGRLRTAGWWNADDMVYRYYGLEKYGYQDINALKGALVTKLLDQLQRQFPQEEPTTLRALAVNKVDNASFSRKFDEDVRKIRLGILAREQGLATLAVKYGFVRSQDAIKIAVGQ